MLLACNLAAERSCMYRMRDWKYWVEKLDLGKHQEGGYYKELYKCAETVAGDRLSVNYDSERSLATSIYFLLPSGEVSKLHRLKSDELWYFHAGSPMTLYIIDVNGCLSKVKLGLDIDNGELPQVIVPRNCTFGAEIYEPDSFTLVGCMVSPGFDFKDFELLPREQLLSEYPQHADIILKLT